jgi:hypothetical protein
VYSLSSGVRTARLRLGSHRGRELEKELSFFTSVLVLGVRGVSSDGPFIGPPIAISNTVGAGH